MTDESPSFSAKPMDESPALANTVKKTTRKKRAAKSSLSDEKKQTRIAKQLAQIYQDNDGRLPNMRSIKIKKRHPALKFLFTLLFLGAALAAAAWIGFFLMPNDKKFSEDQIVLTVDGPKNFFAGSTTTYKIIYGNNQGLALKNATLNIQYPNGFVFLSSEPSAKNSGHTEWSLGEIPPYRKREVSITGVTHGSLNQKQSWRAFLTYQPENFSSELQKAAVLEVVADKSPFSLSVNGPDKITVGSASEYTFSVKKESDSQINKLSLKPSWPQNFFIISSTPPLGKDLTWLIEPKKASSSTNGFNEQKFKLTGKFSPAANATPPLGSGSSTINSGDISASLSALAGNNTYELTATKISTKLAQNNLGFNLAINGSLGNFHIQPGDNLNITLVLKNESADTLKNASLKLILDAPSAKKQSLLDWARLEDKYDGDVRGTQINSTLRRGEIVWNKNKITTLAQINKNEEIVVDIKLPLKTATTINFADIATSSHITALAEVSFTDQNNVSRTFSSNQIIITVNSDLKFESRDVVTVAEDQEKHQITWVLTNNFHPLKNLVLSAEIYGKAETELVSPAPAGEVKLDPTGEKLIWTIPEMPVETDVLALPFTVTLENPNPTQEVLISKVRVQAEDAVTGERLDFMGEETRLRPD